MAIEHHIPTGRPQEEQVGTPPRPEELPPELPVQESEEPQPERSRRVKIIAAVAAGALAVAAVVGGAYALGKRESQEKGSSSSAPLTPGVSPSVNTSPSPDTNNSGDAPQYADPLTGEQQNINNQLGNGDNELTPDEWLTYNKPLVEEMTKATNASLVAIFDAVKQSDVGYVPYDGGMCKLPSGPLGETNGDVKECTDARLYLWPDQDGSTGVTYVLTAESSGEPAFARVWHKGGESEEAEFAQFTFDPESGMAAAVSGYCKMAESAADPCDSYDQILNAYWDNQGYVTGKECMDLWNDKNGYENPVMMHACTSPSSFRNAADTTVTTVNTLLANAGISGVPADSYYKVTAANW